MFKAKYLGWALLLAMASPVTQAATSLYDAWLAAQQVDPEFAAARAEYQAGLTERDQARALLLPQVIGSAGIGRASVNNTTEGAQFATPAMGQSNQVDFRTSINNGTRNQWSVQAEMPIINAEKLAQNRQLRTGAQLAEVRFKQAQQDLILRTAQASFDVMLARENLHALLLQQQAIEKTLKEKKTRYQIGDIPVTDSYEAEAQFQALLAQVSLAQTTLQLKIRSYEDLTHLPGGAMAGVDPSRDIPQAPLTPLENWQVQAMEQSPLIVMQNYGVTVAHAEIDKYRALTAPTLSLVGILSAERLSGNGQYGPSTLSSNSRTVGLQLTIPLYTGGFRGSKFEQAIRLEEKAGYDLDSTRLWVLRQTEAAWLGLSSGRAQVSAWRLALKSNTARLKATLLGNQVGDRTTLDVLNAQTAVADGQVRLLSAQIDWMMNRLRLHALVGDLDENQLREIGPLLSAGRP